MTNTAINAARRAGIILTEFSETDFKIQTKDGNRRNLVTSADLAAEKEIIKIIRKDFPAHKILSEETESAPKKVGDDYLWIIDPLDGTTNYSRGIKDASVSIALARNEDVLLAVVYNPFSRELFRAERGKGTHLNDKPVCVSAVNSLDDAIVTQSFAYSNKLRREPLENINKLFLTVHGIRLYHSTALELCYLAAGRIDGCIISSSSPWDIAAGSLIVEEAGGTVTSFAGEPWHYLNGSLIATNGAIHQELRNLIHH